MYNLALIKFGRFTTRQNFILGTTHKWKDRVPYFPNGQLNRVPYFPYDWLDRVTYFLYGSQSPYSLILLNGNFYCT